MAFTTQQTAEIESAMADFMQRHRPPEHIRDKHDLGWRIEGQSVLIFEIRPFWRDEAQRIEEPVAKAAFVRTANLWRIYWQRADLKWHGYEPHPESVLFDEFLAIVDEDACGCFWG